jgi:DNA-binding SARP family transcriptional activator
MTRGPATDQIEIVVHAASGQVWQRDSVVALRPREREIIVAIAVQSRCASVEFMSELLYPGRDPADGANMVKVNVHRVRRQLGAASIVHCEGGYTLGPRATVDIALARAFLLRFGGGAARFDAGERDRMLQLARDLRRQQHTSMIEFAWHAPVAILAHRVGHDLAMLIARREFERGDLQSAASIAQTLTYEDVCNEEAWELLIRAQLGLGYVHAARGAFRYFAGALARELDAGPSPSILQLIEDNRDAIAV